MRVYSGKKYVYYTSSPEPLTYSVKSGEGRTLSLTYGRFFAEFLGDLSLVRLALLELNTCVGLRYGSHIVMLRGFSWKRALVDFL